MYSLSVCEDAPGALDGLPSQGCQHDLPPGTVDERRLQNGLELLDAGAQRRLGDGARLSRAAEVAVIIERRKVAQVAN